MDVKWLISHPHIDQWTGIFLACCLLLQIVFGVKSIFSLTALPSTLPQMERLKDKQEEKKVLSLAVNTPFFGEYVPKNIHDAGVMQSTLNLKLLGILFSTVEKAAQVIILTPEGQQRIFHVGDSLPEGATLKRITRDGVLILRNGQLERLSLPQNPLLFEEPARPLQLSE